jgi:putative toxin-antitoxin system antitoxin component (TIGR02293 family)
MTISAEMTSVLGGRRVLLVKPRNAAEWQDLIKKGIPFASAEAFKRWLAIGDEALAELLGVSPKTLSRARASNTRLDPVASDRLLRVARIGALAIEVLEDDDRARGWLKRAQIGLGGRAPLALLVTDLGCVEVERLLLRIEHGVYA